MTSYILSVKKNLSEEQWDDVYKHLKAEGAETIKELAGRKAITGPSLEVKFKQGTITTLKKHDNIEGIESDQKVTATENGGKVTFT